MTHPADSPDGGHRGEEDDGEGSMNEPGIFEGDPLKEREEYKERLLDYFYGK